MRSSARLSTCLPTRARDRAELSALTTAVDELTKRITLITERYSGGARDDVLARARRRRARAGRKRLGRLDVATRALER